MTAVSMTVDVYIEAANPTGFTISDGVKSKYSKTSPIEDVDIFSDRFYRVTVNEKEPGCTFGYSPTGLPTQIQPGNHTLVLPFVLGE